LVAPIVSEGEPAVRPLVGLSANTLSYPQGGGHMWVYLNWALGLRDAGCDVVWLEGVTREIAADHEALVANLRARLAPYGFADRIALWSEDDVSIADGVSTEYLRCDESIGVSDLLLNLSYGTPDRVVRLARRSALVDIDPGLLQTWVSQGDFRLPRHDIYFTIGETVGTPEARFPDLGISWHYTPPCVSLSRWQTVKAPASAPFTTVSHWASNDWLANEAGELVSNEKRAGYLAFLDLPRRTSQTLELALQLRSREDACDRAMLVEHGWRVQDAWSVAAMPWDYQRYVHDSLGEFSCVKPSCVWFQNAWISDRTLCYLASGKPAVVQHTGPSAFLPDDAGLCRFHDLDEAVQLLESVSENYERHCRCARAIAEQYFDARQVASRVLERALQ
jgi:hypothetical protein